MRRLITLSAVVTLLFLALGNNVAAGQTPPGPFVRYQFRTEGLPLSGPFDVVQQILNFPPGATTPWHTHPGQLLVTTIEGEGTFRVHGTEKVYKTGESFVELPNHRAQAHNHTTANTVALISYVLPDGAPLSVPEPGDTTPPPRPAPAYQFRTDGLQVPATYDVVHLVQDFAPGAATPWHTHPGQVLVTVLEGSLTFSVNGAEKVYKAGDSFVELPNEVAQASNRSASKTSVMATVLLPKGAPVSHVAAAPAGHGPAPARPLPATGEAPGPVELPNTGAGDAHIPLIALTTSLVLGGWVLRRRSYTRGS